MTPFAQHLMPNRFNKKNQSKQSGSSFGSVLLLAITAVLITGCASTYDGSARSDDDHIVIAADKSLLNESTKDSAQTGTTATDRTRLPVALDGASRRLIIKVVEQAAAKIESVQGAPRSTVVLPIRTESAKPDTVGQVLAMRAAIAQLRKELPGLRLTDPNPAQVTDLSWVIVSTLKPIGSSAQAPDRRANQHETLALCMRVVDAKTGEILAAERQFVRSASINTVPTTYYRELPIALAWPDLLEFSGSCHNGKPPDNMQMRLRATLAFVAATNAYERASFQTARRHFTHLLNATESAQIATVDGPWTKVRTHALSGQYLSDWRWSKRRSRAARSLRGLIAKLLNQSEDLPLNLSMSPVSVQMIASKAIRKRNESWLREISRYLNRAKQCARIRGHAPGQLDDGTTKSKKPLAFQHARYVETRLRKHARFKRRSLIAETAPPTKNQSLSRTGDVRDEWSRRVDVIRSTC